MTNLVRRRIHAWIEWHTTAARPRLLSTARSISGSIRAKFALLMTQFIHVWMGDHPGWAADHPAWMALPKRMGGGRPKPVDGAAAHRRASGADGVPDRLDLDELADVIWGLVAFALPVDRIGP